MLSLSDYVEKAKERNNFTGNRELSYALGLSGAGVSQWLNRGAWPKDEAMVKLADLAGMDRVEALINLAVWRSEGEALSTWQEVMSSLKRTACLLVFLVFSCFATPAKAANITGTSGHEIVQFHNYRINGADAGVAPYWDPPGKFKHRKTALSGLDSAV